MRILFSLLISLLISACAEAASSEKPLPVAEKINESCLEPLTKQQVDTFSKYKNLHRKEKISQQEFFKNHYLYQQSSNFNDVTLLARAVFSEGISTDFRNQPQCKSYSSEIFEAIGWGIMNRVRVKKERFGKSLREVLFKLDQFNPTTSPLTEYSRLFACPENYFVPNYYVQLSCHAKKDYNTEDLFRKYWEQAKAAAEKILSGRVKNPLPSKATSFYYPQYRYSDGKQCRQYKKPKWANPKKVLKNIIINGKALPQDCMWFFKN